MDDREVREHGISIHSLRMEGDMDGKTSLVTHRLFQSTPSAWRETHVLSFLSVFLYISIHSLRMEGDSQLTALKRQAETISIHSLRMEGDTQYCTKSQILRYFNPLPPHGGRPCLRHHRGVRQ